MLGNVFTSLSKTWSKEAHRLSSRMRELCKKKREESENPPDRPPWVPEPSLRAQISLYSLSCFPKVYIHMCSSYRVLAGMEF